MEFQRVIQEHVEAGAADGSAEPYRHGFRLPGNKAQKFRSLSGSAQGGISGVQVREKGEKPGVPDGAERFFPGTVHKHEARFLHGGTL